jgi:hypothetical protein
MHSIRYETAEKWFHPGISTHQPSHRICDFKRRSQFDHAGANNRSKLGSRRDWLNVYQVIIPNGSFQSGFDSCLKVLISAPFAGHGDKAAHFGL